MNVNNPLQSETYRNSIKNQVENLREKRTGSVVVTVGGASHMYNQNLLPANLGKIGEHLKHMFPEQHCIDTGPLDLFRERTGQKNITHFALKVEASKR